MSKKRIILVGVLFGIIIIGLIIYLVLTLTTDIFKPASEMFEYYLKQNIEEINSVTDLSKEQEYVKTLLQSNYRDNTLINLDYVNSQGKQEGFHISSNGITNNTENNSYRTIGIKFGESFNVMNLEYLKKNQTYGVLFSEAVKQFVCANVNSIDDLLDIVGIEKNELQKYDISESVDFITNKKETIENIFVSYMKKVNTNRFKKKSNEQVTLNNGEVKNAKAYSITLSKDETKELYLDILKELGKQKEINEINTTKRFFSETKIIIYVEEKQPIRMAIDVQDMQFRIDFYEDRINIKFNDITTEEIKTRNIDIKKEEQKRLVDYSDSYNNKFSLEYSVAEDVSKKNAKITLNAQNDYIKGINLTVDQDIEMSNTVIEGITKSFENQESVNLSNLKIAERNTALNELLKRIDSVLTKKNNQINSEILNMWIKCNNMLEEQYQGFKEKQKKIFNNQFLTYKGQDVKKDIIYNLLDLAGKNLKSYETIGEDSYKLYISEGTQNVKFVEELKEKIKKSKKQFNIDFGYDSDGKLNLIKIQGYEKK